MSTKTKKKLCWNCEGNVALQDETCPYCGVSLDVTPIAGTGGKDIHLIPPYKLVSNPQDQMIPEAPYPAQNPEPVTAEENTPPLPEAEETFNDINTIALPLSTLLLGAILVLFGLILFLFSDSHGVFTLHWNGTYWYLYLIIGVPLLYFGWKTSGDMVEQEDPPTADKEQ